MKSQCILAVEQAIGRQLGKGEADAIERRIERNLRELARTDPAFLSKSRQDQILEAAQTAMQQAQQTAAKQAQRKASNLLAQVRETQRLSASAATWEARRDSLPAGLKGAPPAHAALFERMRQIDNYVSGVRSEMIGRLVDTILAAEPRILGLMHDARAMHDFVREVYQPGSTGNQVAQRGAKAYLDGIEVLRLRENAAGANIGKLDYGYLPQPHDVAKVVKAGRDAWVGVVENLIDGRRYFNDDGTAMTAIQRRELLEAAYDTISTEGRNKMEPSAAGGRGSRASRYDEAHRALHFTNADSYLAYMNAFGRAGSVFEAIQGHVGLAAKNIGLMEEWGANPAQTYRVLKATAEKIDNVVGEREFTVNLDQVWSELNGTTAQPVSARLAEVGQSIRSYLAATKLGSAVISSVTDLSMLSLSAKYNGLPIGRTLVKSLSSFGGDIAKDAARLGIATEYLSSEMTRWNAENMTSGLASKLATSTLRASGLEAWTHSLRRAFSLMLMESLDRMRAQDWGALSKADLSRLGAAGVTEQDWRLWRLADATDFREQKLLSPDGLRSLTQRQTGIVDPAEHALAVNRATARLLGLVDQEATMAVLAPDLMTRAAANRGLQAGTPEGEIARSAFLFKRFPLAMINRNLQRMRTMEKGKLGYSVTMFTSMTLLGALAIQLKDLVAGKDPRDMSTDKFWKAAVLQGGGLGILGDVFYTGLGGNSRAGQANWTSFTGPVFSTAADLADLTLGNLGELADGKETDFNAEFFRFARNNTPLINLWYLRAALGHAVLDDIQNTISPNYIARMKDRTRRDWGQRYWWEPGEPLPDRAPDLAAAVGE